MLMVVPVPVTAQLLDRLVNDELLSAAAVEDAGAVGEAIAKFMSRRDVQQGRLGRNFGPST